MKAPLFQDCAREEGGEKESRQLKPSAVVNPPPPFDVEPDSDESLHEEFVFFETPAGTMGGYVARDLVDDDGSNRYQKEASEVKNDLTNELAHICLGSFIGESWRSGIQESGSCTVVSEGRYTGKRGSCGVLNSLSTRCKSHKYVLLEIQRETRVPIG